MKILSRSSINSKTATSQAIPLWTLWQPGKLSRQIRPSNRKGAWAKIRNLKVVKDLKRIPLLQIYLLAPNEFQSLKSSPIELLTRRVLPKQKLNYLFMRFVKCKRWKILGPSRRRKKMWNRVTGYLSLMFRQLTTNTRSKRMKMRKMKSTSIS